MKMGKTVWKKIGNGNKYLVGMEMGMEIKLVGMGGNGKLKPIPALLYSRHLVDR